MIYQFEKSGTLKEPTEKELAEADSNSAVIVLDRGALEDGTPYWAYVAVKLSRYREFLRVTAARQPMRLQDYGAILKYGLDKEVPDSVKMAMRKEYNFDENYISVLVQDIIKAQAEFLKQQETQRIDDIVSMLKKKPS